MYALSSLSLSFVINLARMVFVRKCNKAIDISLYLKFLFIFLNLYQ